MPSEPDHSTLEYSKYLIIDMDHVLKVITCSRFDALVWFKINLEYLVPKVNLYFVATEINSMSAHGTIECSEKTPLSIWIIIRYRLSVLVWVIFF